MADSTITVAGVVLYDRWPGKGCVTTPDVENITDMTSTLVGHNQGTAKYPLGTKWQLYCRGNAASLGVAHHRGWSTFVYLKAESTATTAIACSALYFACPNGTLAPAMSRDSLYIVTADSDRTTHETMGLVAMALSTMTNSYYGWFWCGGVCPVEYVPGITTASVFQCLNDIYSAQTVSALMSVATAATEVGFGAAATDGQTQIVGEALYAQGT